ncbi:MAG: MOSC domain-containing protein [Actinobacteria bacterium]|nr:MOSC domain-containing protein [Actinomycetota bacterium]MCA1721746.1 MOSC domain-containing protein [Actinomycetota bacterium]
MPCPTCAFDVAAWSPSDLRRTLNDVEPWFRQIAADAPAPVVAALEPMWAELAELPRGVVDAGAVHTAWRLLSEAGRLRHAMGAGAPSDAGTVVQVSTSPGGVPKLPVASAQVTRRGLVGDKQANRVHHGRPRQAVCLWSADVIDALADEGQPIGYGSTGENLTLRGLDWRSIRPGVRLQVGEALLETTPYAIPCKKNAQWFVDGRFRRMSHDVHPGSSRIYARVLVEGVVVQGDRVLVEPLILPVPRTTEGQLAFGW